MLCTLHSCTLVSCNLVEEEEEENKEVQFILLPCSVSLSEGKTDMVVEQHFLQLFSIQRPSPSPPPPLSLLPPCKTRSQFISSLHKNGTPSQLSLRTSSSSSSRIRAALSQDEIPPNAVRQKRNPDWLGGFSLGVDLGLSRTGVAISKGFVTRPLTVLELRGEKLELRLLEIAEREEVDEFIIGIPKSGDGKENLQSNKVRSVAGRLAVKAAERGWRVYLQNEHGTSTEARDFMLNMGFTKSARQGKIDAYAAMMVLERYFSMSGVGTELVIPKQLELQERLRQGPPKDLDFFPEQIEG